MRQSMSLHFDTQPEVEVIGYKDMGDETMRTFWLNITIGTFTLTCFVPTIEGIDQLMTDLGRGTLYKDSAPIEVQEVVDRVEYIPVEVTSYNADEAQTDSTPTITASGERVREGIVALSRDLEQKYGLKFGDLVQLEAGPYSGVYEFQDRMNKRIQSGVDIFRWDRADSLQIGRRAGTLKVLPRQSEDIQSAQARGSEQKEQEQKQEQNG